MKTEALKKLSQGVLDAVIYKPAWWIKQLNMKTPNLNLNAIFEIIFYRISKSILLIILPKFQRQPHSASDNNGQEPVQY